MAPSASFIDQPTDIDTTLNHYLDPELGGHTSYEVGTASYYRRKFDERPVHVHDIRGQEGDYNINVHGFQHVKNTSAEKDFLDDQHIKEIYYPEIEALLKNITGCTRVHIFSHIIRRDSRDKLIATAKADPSLKDLTNIPKIAAAHYVHIDQSNAGAVEVLEDCLPADVAEDLSKTRWGIINVWRPIKGPIIKDPLAVCDARRALDDDLVTVIANFPPKDLGLKYSDSTPGRRFQVLYAKYNPEHKWHYVSKMTTDEVLLIKCFDSLEDGKTARRVPHSAFTDPKTKDLDEVRESIETRCLLFYEDQPNESGHRSQKK